MVRKSHLIYHDLFLRTELHCRMFQFENTLEVIVLVCNKSLFCSKQKDDRRCGCGYLHLRQLIMAMVTARPIDQFQLITSSNFRARKN